MTKYEALKQLPVERFADLFYDMAHKAKDSEEFKQVLLEEFPQDLIPALQRCSTGEDLDNMLYTAVSIPGHSSSMTMTKNEITVRFGDRAVQLKDKGR